MTSRDPGALASIEPAAQPAEARQDRRRQLLWSGMLQTAHGPSQCVVVDISRGGARLLVATAVEVKQPVSLVVSGLGMFRGTVIWSEAGTIGIEFD